MNLFVLSTSCALLYVTSFAALSGDWNSKTIGSDATGSATITDTNVTVQASGRDIGKLADEMHFIYSPAQGDIELVTRVSALEETNPWAKAGLMIRATLQEGSRNVYLCATAQHGLCWQCRWEDEGKTLQDRETADSTFPNTWIKLVRKGKQCAAFFSNDGKNWQPLGEPQELDLPETYLIGLAVTSHVEGVFTTARFDNLSLMPKKK